MAFSKHGNYETPATGTQNWDASINENFDLIEKGPTIKATAGLTISIDNVLYIDTSGNFQLAIADGTSASRYTGLSTTSIDNNVDGYARMSGYHNNPDWFFTRGQPVYLSAVTAGGLTTIAPAEKVMVGFAIQTNEIIIRPWLEHDEMFGLSNDDHIQYLYTDNRRSTSGLTVSGILNSSGVDTTHLTATNSTISGLTVSNIFSSGNITDDSGSYVKIASGLTVTNDFNMSGNLGVGTIDQFSAGIGVIGIANSTVIPTENPIGGGTLWVQDGGLYYIGSAGTTTLIANA
jgi:hypothetical protein